MGELSVVERAVEEDRPWRSDHRRSEHGARLGRRGQGWLIVLCALAVVVAGAAGVIGLVRHQISSQLTYIADPFADIGDRPASIDPAPGAAAPVNILLLGSDSRISAGDPSEWSYGAQRTDAIMLLHISGDRQSVQVMSIPRDSWVPIPGYGENKVNAAFSFGGPSLMIETVEQLTGVRIDHFAVADFESFAALTDDLGGVQITLPDGMDSRGVELEPGTYTLTGEQALAYVRERYALSRGDFDRVQRQQNWIRAILHEAFDDGALTDPFLLTSLLKTAAGAMTVDEGFTMGTMTSLALSLRDVRPTDVTFLTVPTSGTGWSDDGQSIVVVDRLGFDSLMGAVADDAVAGYLDTHPEVEVLGGPGSVR